LVAVLKNLHRAWSAQSRRRARHAGRPPGPLLAPLV